MTLRFIPQKNLTVGIHVLRHVFGNPNRGENNEPKTIWVGATERSAITYQSYNAALRLKLREVLPESAFGRRTAKITDLIIEHGKGKLPDIELRSVANSIGIGLRGKEESKSKNDSDKTQVMLFGTEELDQLIAQLVKLKEENPKQYATLCDPMAEITEKFISAVEASTLDNEIKSFLVEKTSVILNQKKLKSLDELKEVTIPANITQCSNEEVAVWVKAIEDLENIDNVTAWVGKTKSKNSSHVEIRKIMEGIKIDAPMPLEKKLLGSFSTSKDTFPPVQSSLTTMGSVGVCAFKPTVDYFASMDDCNNNGAAHIGKRPMHSDLGYEYISLNLRDYLKNNKGDKVEAAEIVQALVYATMHLQFMGGRKFGGNQHPPVFMMIEVHPSNNCFNHLSAFANPVTAMEQDGVDLAAIKRLVNHATSINNGKQTEVFAWFSNNDFKALIPENIKTSNRWEEFSEMAKKATETQLETL